MVCLKGFHSFFKNRIKFFPHARCACTYSLLIASFYQQALAIMGQGSLMAMRNRMFASMQRLPIRYFDTHKHGDIMSYYTNDIDLLRQLITQVVPNALMQGTILVCVFFIMLYYSIWLNSMHSLLGPSILK